MERAFGPWCDGVFYSWGFTPGWYGPRRWRFEILVIRELNASGIFEGGPRGRGPRHAGARALQLARAFQFES